MSDYYIRKGDTAGILADVLKDDEGQPVDIAGATIELTVTPIGGGTPIVSGGASNDQVGDGADGSKGAVHYEWASPQTDEAGDFLGEWKVTIGGEVQTYPNAGYILISITEAPPQATSRYLTREELKKTLDVQGLTFADEDIDDAIEAASRSLEAHYGGPWGLGTPGEVRYFTPWDGMTTIDVGALDAVTEVALDTAGGGVYNELLVDGVDYRLEPDAGPPWNSLRMLRAGLAWTWEYDPRLTPYPWGRDALRVTGTWGYPEVPGGVRAAVKIIATRILKRIRDAPFGIVGIGLEGAAVKAGQIANDPEVAFAMSGVRRKRKFLY